jgi:hypothetical protein
MKLPVLPHGASWRRRVRPNVRFIYGYLRKEWCIQVIENPIKVERQEHNRFRFWGEIKELGDLILRVVTLDDKKTIHNAFPDRRFKP